MESISIPDGFSKVCHISEIKEKIGKKFIINDEEIAIFFVDGNYYATSNMCPHQHARIIFDGFVEEDEIVCPAHGWAFNLKTGKMAGGRKGLRVFETVVIDKYLYAKVTPQSFNW